MSLLDFSNTLHPWFWIHGIYYCVEYLKPTFRAKTLLIFKEVGMQIYEEAKIIIVKKPFDVKNF